MKKIKCIIIIASVILLIILLFIGNTLIQLHENIDIVDYEVPEVPTEVALEQETNGYAYMIANDIINRFFEYMNANNIIAINSVLDEDYKNKNNITEKNVLKQLEKYKDVKSYFSKEIYVQKIVLIQTYSGQYSYVKGIIRKDRNEENVYLLIKEDLMNETYTISFLEEQEFNKIKNYGSTENKADFSIEENEFNKTNSVSSGDKAICEILLQDYINSIENNPQLAYNLLDEEYRNIKFGNVENYIKYINNLNLDNILIEKYLFEKQEGYNQYICEDLNGNCYIFKNTNFMNYSVFLDMYTVNIPQFVERYNDSKDEEKVKLNIHKLIAATKDEDYKYVYNKLDDTFRATNFSKQTDFEKFIKEKYNKDDELIFTKYEKINNVHVYDIEITKSDGSTKNAQIVMRLKEGTDFVMSFSAIE